MAHTVPANAVTSRLDTDCSLARATKGDDTDRMKMVEYMLLSLMPSFVVLVGGQLAIAQRDLDDARDEILHLRDTVALLFPKQRRRMVWLKTVEEAKRPWRVIARHILKAAGNPFHPIMEKRGVIYTLRHRE